MSAAQMRDCQGKPAAFFLFPQNREIAHNIHPAGAAAHQNTLVFRIQIDQAVSAQLGAVKAESTVHARFLIYGHQHFKLRMMQRVIIEDRKHHGDGNAVVAAERGLIRPDPLAVCAQVKTLCRHVLRALVRLGADHVDVTL